MYLYTKITIWNHMEKQPCIFLYSRKLWINCYWNNYWNSILGFQSVASKHDWKAGMHWKGKGRSLVIMHSAPYFSLNSRGVACWVRNGNRTQILSGLQSYACAPAQRLASLMMEYTIKHGHYLLTIY